MFAQPFLTRVPPNLFLLNPKHQGFLNGEERKFYDFTCSVVVLIFIGLLIFGGIGGAMFYAGADEMLIRSQLERSGLETRATVTDHDYTTSTNKGRTSYTYYLTYKYSIDASPANGPTRFTYRQQVSNDTYNNFTDGEAITVSYMPNNPSVSRLLTDNQDNGTVLAVVGGIFLACALFCLFGYLRQRSRNGRLIRDGQMVVGKIVEAKAAKVKSGNQLTIRYTFMSPEGGELGRKEILVRNDLRDAPLPQPGTPVAIVYVNDKLYRVL